MVGVGDFPVGGVKSRDEWAASTNVGPPYRLRTAITLLADGSPGGLLVNKKTGQTEAGRKLRSSVRHEMNEPRLAQTVLDQEMDQATSTVKKQRLVLKHGEPAELRISYPVRRSEGTR